MKNRTLQIEGGRPTPLGVAVVWATAVSLLVGCAGNAEQMATDLATLEQRIAELEHSASIQGAQLNDVEEDVLLLEDRVEAQRLSLERRGTVRVRSHSELPSYRPPQVQPDERYMSQLPVERLTPPPAALSAPTEVAELEEIVITNETLAEFVEEHGGAQPASYQSGQRALPPVVVGDRLAAGGQPSATTPNRTLSMAAAASSSAEASLDQYQAALAHFNEGSYQRALEEFRGFLAAGPSPDYADNALFWIGECHYASGDYGRAAEQFERVVRDFPDGNKVPDSLLKLGLSYEQMDARDRASEVLASLVEAYPTTDAARRASEWLAELN